MKKIYQITMGCLLAMLSLTSCSKDSQDSGSANYTVSTLQSTYENTIMASPEYLAYNTARNIVKTHANGTVPNFNSRTAFQSWVAANIGSTTFQSVADAMTEFDNVITTYENLEKEFSDFYDELIKVSDADMLVITSKEFSAKPSGGTLTPCQGNCAGNMDTRWDNMDNTYNAMSHSHWALDRAKASMVAQCEQISIVDDFNDCMNSCR